MTIAAVLIFSIWKSINIHHSYFQNKKMTRGNIWNVCFSVLMCYWLITASALFLIAKIIDGLFALIVGGYLWVAPIPEELTKDRSKIINSYWGYALADIGICFGCFIFSLLGVSNG